MKSWFLQYLPHQMLDSGALDIRIQSPKSLKNVTCKHACQKTQLLCQSLPKTSKWRPRNPSKIDRNLSCQKTESTIVLAMLQSTGKFQMVFSHKRGTENASKVVFGPRLRRGLDHATEPNNLQEFCTFSAKVHQKLVKVTKNETKSTK